MVCFAKRGQALKAANADMAMVQPHQYCRARRAGFIAPVERLACFNDGKGPAGFNS